MEVTRHRQVKGEPLVLVSGVGRVIEGGNGQLSLCIPRVSPIDIELGETELKVKSPY